MRPIGAILAAGLLAACVAVEVPPREISRGYRAKTPQGVDIVFDARRAVYVVADVPGRYWVDGHYYRESGAGWQTGPGVEGPWAACAAADLPPGLRPDGAPPGRS